MPDKPHCESIEVDGQPVLARAAGELTPLDIEAIREYEEILRGLRAERRSWHAAKPTEREGFV